MCEETTTKDGEEADAHCYFCERILDEEHLCYGCGAYICDDCDPGTITLDPQHDIDDHWIPGVE